MPEIDPEGTLRWWGETTRDVVLNPHSFFRSLESEENFYTPAIFVVLTQTINLLLYLVVAAGGLVQAIPGIPLSQVGTYGVMAAVIVGGYLFIAFGIALGGTLLLAGLFNVFYYYLGGIGRMSSTFKVFAYLSAFAIPFTALNLIGTAVGGMAAQAVGVAIILLWLYWAYVSLIGFSARHDISMWRAAVPYVVIIGILFALVAIAVYVVGPILGPLMTAGV